MQEDDEQQFDIGNQDHFDHAPDEFKDHLMQAFIHAAGKGKHPGKYAGPEPEPPPDDAITEGDLQRAHEGEASAAKMRAAQTGGASLTALGPSDIDIAQVKQRDASQQQTATQGAQAAAQAQGAQAPVNAPPAPTGPTGVSAPYPAQRAPQPPPSATQGLPQPGEEAPPAPGPNQGPPQ
jgi:hypothetical protein